MLGTALEQEGDDATNPATKEEKFEAARLKFVEAYEISTDPIYRNNQAIMLKKIGDVLFGNGDYRGAVKKYSAAYSNCTSGDEYKQLLKDNMSLAEAELTAEALFDEAEELYIAGNYIKAKQEYQDAYSTSNITSAKTNYAAGLAKAEAEIDAHASFIEANKLFDQGRYEGASALYETAKNKSVIEREKSKYREGIKLSENEVSAKALFDKAEELNSKGEYAKAMELCDEAYEKSNVIKEKNIYHNQRGVISLKRRNKEGEQLKKTQKELEDLKIKLELVTDRLADKSAELAEALGVHETDKRELAELLDKLKVANEDKGKSDFFCSRCVADIENDLKEIERLTSEQEIIKKLKSAAIKVSALFYVDDAKQFSSNYIELSAKVSKLLQTKTVKNIELKLIFPEAAKVTNKNDTSAPDGCYNPATHGAAGEGFMDQSVVQLASPPPLQGLSGGQLISINGIHSLFHEYTMEGIGKVLNLRLRDNQLSNVTFLANYRFNDQDDSIVNMLSNLSFIKEEIILVPISLHDKHAVGLMLIKQYDFSFKAYYFDPANEPIPGKLEEELIEHGYMPEQLSVEQQIYTNCGPEVVENFMLYLTGERLSQEDAIMHNSRLVEHELLTPSTAEEVNFLTLKDSYNTQATDIIPNIVHNIEVGRDSYIIGNSTGYDMVTPQSIIDGAIVGAIGTAYCEPFVELSDYNTNHDYVGTVLGEVSCID